jgi:hypothetical protein
VMLPPLRPPELRSISAFCSISPDLDLISHLKAIPVGEAFCVGVARMRQCWGFCRPSPWRNRYWAMASRTQALLPSNGVIGDPNAPAHQPGCS